jgi:phosphoribosylamine--glycine ligase
MNILLVGNGAREHAIAEAISKSKTKTQLYAYMSRKNPGIAAMCKGFELGDTCDADSIAAWAKKKRISLAVVGPEAPLDAGVVDALETEGIKVASPNKSAARLETDKAFTRHLMKKYDIPGAPIFKIIVSKDEIDEFIDSLSMDVVVKPAGLTGGKGVKIEGEHLKDKDEVKAYSAEILEGDVGTIDMAVIEEKLVGEEFTLQAFVSPDEILGMPMVQDHKRAYEGDKGPNTGGMGSYTGKGYILPFLTKEDYEFALNVMREAVKALKKETKETYTGILYGQFIVTQNGPKLIEFNTRFGDPEAMNVLSLFEGDFVKTLEAMVDGGLEDVDVNFMEKATVCKYLVPEGYPENPSKGAEITIDEEAIKKAGASIYYASVGEEDGRITTSGSRAIALIGVGDSISAAEKIAERAMRYVKGPLEHRKDIGTEDLIQKRFKHIEHIRG